MAPVSAAPTYRVSPRQERERDGMGASATRLSAARVAPQHRSVNAHRVRGAPPSSTARTKRDTGGSLRFVAASSLTSGCAGRCGAVWQALSGNAAARGGASLDVDPRRRSWGRWTPRWPRRRPARERGPRCDVDTLSRGRSARGVCIARRAQESSAGEQRRGRHAVRFGYRLNGPLSGGLAPRSRWSLRPSRSAPDGRYALRPAPCALRSRWSLRTDDPEMIRRGAIRRRGYDAVGRSDHRERGRRSASLPAL